MVPVPDAQGDLLRADETRTKRRVDSESDGLDADGSASGERPVAEFQRLCRAPHVVPWFQGEF